MGRSRFWGLVLNARARCHSVGLGAPTWSEGSSLQHLSQMVLWSWALFSSFQLPGWNIPPKTVNSLLHQEHKAMNGSPGVPGGVSRQGLGVGVIFGVLPCPEPAACSCLRDPGAKQARERCLRVCCLATGN